jgi:uncharacterized GH25 family protein
MISHRNSKRVARTLLAAAAAWLVPALASAHQVWIEENAGATKLYFGEYGDNQREESPGYLDKLAKPTATLVTAQGDKTLESTKTKDAISFKGRAAKGESVVIIDAAYPVLEGKDGDKPVRSVWTPAARYVTDLRAQTPKLPLDIVPTGTPGEFQVLYRGAPLPKAEAALVAVSGWSLESRTDELGKLKFTLPWKGGYALLVRHKDPTKGSRKSADGKDEAYDVASFATTLTFVTTSGLPSPPAPPAAPANKMEPPAPAPATKAEAPKPTAPKPAPVVPKPTPAPAAPVAPIAPLKK